MREYATTEQGGRFMKFWPATLLTCVAGAAQADVSALSIEGYADVRMVGVDSELDSFLYGGLGLLRYDDDHDGLRLNRLALDFDASLTESLQAHGTIAAAEGSENSVIDLTEAFLEWRPYPQSQWSWRTKIGAFYPPISLENRSVAWQSIYSLSPSAINTWIGEEVRTIGMELRATNSGASTQRVFDVSLIAAVYGWNDPMGVLLFQRGWAIHDYEVPVFGAIPRPFPRGTHDQSIEFSHEIDGRAGYYAGLETRWYGRHVFRALHYDNRGDPAQSNRTDGAWRSRFDAVGVRLELPSGLTLMSQWMGGDTGVGPSADRRGMLIADFHSWFALASYLVQQHRFTVRYESMGVHSTRGTRYFDSEQDAHALTAAYTYHYDLHWLVGLEALRIDGTLQQRELKGLPAAAIEQQLQIAVRYSF
jgi:hypothetical protein